jgi:hypothetical protein
MTTGAVECAELHEQARACDSDVRRYDGDDDAFAGRARRMLTETAQTCRDAAGVFEADPTLADEPYETGRLCAVAVLAVVAGQLRGALRRALVDTDAAGGLTREQRRAEAEAAYEGVCSVAKHVREDVPRDHMSAAAVREISRARLVAQSDGVAAAADRLAQAVAGALGLPHPDPRAVELAALADDLTQCAAALAVEHDGLTANSTHSRPEES